MALGPYGQGGATLGFVMRLKHFALAALPGALLVFAACGDGAGSDETPTAESTTNPDDFGPAPILGGNIEEISPAHAERVPFGRTVTTNQLDPKGVCVKVNFDGLPAYGQSFRFIVDEQDVTAGGDTVWIVGTNVAPKDGTICWAPKGGIAVGVHSAAIGVQDPNNLRADFKQIVDWKFEVTP